jgi:hypothetical protein
MFGSEILDVAIGLILIFLLLSLICSSVREAIETVMKHRARDLERGIREMFGDINRRNLVPEFYRHPLINGLFKGKYDPNSLKNLPSYIPPRTFAVAVLDMVRSMGAPQVPAAEPPGPNPAAAIAAELRNGLAAMPPDSMLRGALLPLVETAGTDIVRARQNIEDWYNASMDRVAGWYKRRTQIIIAAIGFSAAALMNVDAIGITRYLNTSQTAKALVVARAEALKQMPVPTTSDLVNSIGWLEQQGGVPIGWQWSPGPGQTQDEYAHDWRKQPVSVGEWFLKIAGILFTGFAVSLGAPFWFDVLNRFMVIRSTVKPEEKSQEEKSKD